eukprot:1731590-Prymnesium_polylepis.2
MAAASQRSCRERARLALQMVSSDEHREECMGTTRIGVLAVKVGGGSAARHASLDHLRETATRVHFLGPCSNRAREWGGCLSKTEFAPPLICARLYRAGDSGGNAHMRRARGRPRLGVSAARRSAAILQADRGPGCLEPRRGSIQTQAEHLCASPAPLREDRGRT